MKDKNRIEELKVKSIMDSMKPEEIYLFNECTKILYKKGYHLRVDGAHSFTINCNNPIPSNCLNLEVKARTTSLLELYKLARECNKTKAKRNRWYFWAIAPSVVAAVFIQNLFFISLMIIIVAAFLAFEPESDDISFTVSDKKDEPEAGNLHKVTSGKQPLNRQVWEELLTIAKEFKKLSTSEKIYLLIFLATLSFFIFPWIFYIFL